MFFLLATVLNTCAISEGAEWIPFFRYAGNSGTVSFDKESIRSASNGIVRVWVKQENNPPEIRGNMRIEWLVSYIEMDCENARHRYLQQIYYLTDGRQHPVLGTSPWVYNAPQTMPENLKERVCR